MGVDVFWSKGNNSYHFSYKTQKYWYFIKSFPNTKGGMNKIQIMMIINRPLNWTLDPCISSKVPKDHATIKLEGLYILTSILSWLSNKSCHVHGSCSLTLRSIQIWDPLVPCLSGLKSHFIRFLMTRFTCCQNVQILAA